MIDEEAETIMSEQLRTMGTEGHDVCVDVGRMLFRAKMESFLQDTQVPCSPSSDCWMKVLASDFRPQSAGLGGHRKCTYRFHDAHISKIGPHVTSVA